jgi:DNA-binding transcriptional ArsR family regulator
MNAPSPTSAARSLDAVAGALSDGTRREILRLVRDEECSAGQIAGQFPQITRPAVSQHLKVLHDAGLVSVRAAGKFRLFQARVEGMADMWEFVDEMWTDRLGRLKIAAERAEWSQRQRARLADVDLTTDDQHHDTRPKGTNHD